MQMQKGMDTGDVWLQSSCLVKEADTSQSLHDRLSKLSGNALMEAIEVITSSEQQPTPQLDEEATYCTKIQKKDGLIDWADPAQIIIRKLRAYDPWPGIFTYINERRVRIINAVEEINDNDANPGIVLDANASGILVSCGSNSLRVLEMIPAGGKRMQAADFANSTTVVGITLGQHQ